MKKLYTDFTNKEKELLKNILKNRKYKRITIVPHAKERMVEKHIAPKDVSDALKDFTIIELHQRGWDTRILVRGKAEDRFGRNTCLSLSLVTFRVITAYKNSVTDNHYTLHTENYEDINVVDLLEKLTK
jgi:hypothetical protein